MAKKPLEVATVTANELDGVNLEEFVNRRHPDYSAHIDHWNFVEACYRGGRAWFDDDGKAEHANLFKFYKEGNEEYKDRKRRTYRANNTKRVVDTVNQYLFRSPATRDNAAVPAPLREFWLNTDKEETPIDRFMKEIDKWVSVLGRVYVGIDRRVEVAATRSQEKAPYAYWIPPQRVLDFSTNVGDGDLDWINILEEFRNAAKPGDSGEMVCQWRVWTRTAWYVIRYRKKASKAGPANSYYIHSSDVTGLGCVPIVPVADQDGTAWSSPGLVDDIAYMDRTLVNYGSLLDEILYEQTFSTLTMPAEGIVPGSAEYNKIVNAAKNRMLLYSTTAPGVMPAYIHPDAQQADLILKAMLQLRKEIYAVTGTDNDANSQSQSKGKEYSSGKVREFDHKQIENILLDKARALEEAEDDIAEVVLAWMSLPVETQPQWVRYPDKFDIRGLAAEMDIAAHMAEIKVPVEVMRRQMNLVNDKAFSRLSDKERSDLEAIVSKWTPGYKFDEQMREREVVVEEKLANVQDKTATGNIDIGHKTADAATTQAEGNVQIGHKQADTAAKAQKIAAKVAMKPAPKTAAPPGTKKK